MAKKEIYTEIKIYATPEKIWNILTDFSNYHSWNPFIDQISGEILEEKKIQVKINPVGGNPMQFKPTLQHIEINHKLSWLGIFLFKGLFDGLHQFEIIDNNDSSIQFIQKENFSGLLVSLFNLDKTRLGFEAMNQALKQKAEL
ncbi:SRPBCC domain-containing protein [Rhizosphaericola mali]|nr:SRPBCC domain-containing protein [Rhizosphaericola mali]